jgi:hypothetical protein
MDLGWKVLIPVGLVWVLVTGALVLIAEGGGLSTNARLGLAGGGIIIAVIGLATSRGDAGDDKDAAARADAAAGSPEDAPVEVAP